VKNLQAGFDGGQSLPYVTTIGENGMKIRMFGSRGWILMLLGGTVFATFATCTRPTENSGSFYLVSTHDDLVKDVLGGVGEIFDDD